MQRNPTKDDTTELLGAFTQALTNFDDVVEIYNERIKTNDYEVNNDCNIAI
jgi:hypothetical protein